jgi:hypothetical protein
VRRRFPGAVAAAVLAREPGPECGRAFSKLRRVGAAADAGRAAPRARAARGGGRRARAAAAAAAAAPAARTSARHAVSIITALVRVIITRTFAGGVS